MRIALVHDWLLKLGGAERVLFALHKIFPEAPIYTLFYDKKFVSRYLPGAQVIPSFLQRFPNIRKIHPWFKVLMPLAVESLDFSGFDPAEQGFDLVISSSHEFSHGILVKPKTKHICFYHSPSRILWDRAHDYLKDFKERGRGSFKLSLIKLGQHFLRIWDWTAGQRVDIAVANSKHVAERIKKYYGREARVVYPPVEIRAVREHSVRSFSGAPAAPSEVVGRFASLRSDRAKTASESAHRTFPHSSVNYFLIVSQLYPHKNIDLAIKAFKNLPELNLLIAGEGPEKKRLERLIRDSTNIKLLGFVSDEELSYYYQNCLAYLISNEEDFGISPIEAMTFGKPVLAYKLGGALETVQEGITGEFFGKLEPDYLADSVRAFYKKIKEGCYKEAVIKKHSEKFSQERFRKEIMDILNSLGYNVITN